MGWGRNKSKEKKERRTSPSTRRKIKTNSIFCLPHA